MYLYQSDVIDSLPTIPFEDALKNNPCGKSYLENIQEYQGDFVIRNMKLGYQFSGLPYYQFGANGTEIMLAVPGNILAFSYDDIKSNPEYLAKYNDFQS